LLYFSTARGLEESVIVGTSFWRCGTGQTTPNEQKTTAQMGVISYRIVKSLGTTMTKDFEPLEPALGLASGKTIGGEPIFVFPAISLPHLPF
jgi:hypothetical protein